MAILRLEPDGTRTVEPVAVTPVRREQFAPLPQVPQGPAATPGVVQAAIAEHTATQALQLDRLQRDMDRVTLLTRENPALDCNTIKDVAIPAFGIVVVKHMLGRPYRGWRMCRPRGVAPLIFEDPNPSADLDAVQLTIESVTGAPATVDLEVW